MKGKRSVLIYFCYQTVGYRTPAFTLPFSWCPHITITYNQPHLRLWYAAYLLTLPLFMGVSCVRALSPTWTGSPAQETLISRTHLFLPHDLPPTKKSWPTFCDQYFWKFPIWNSRADEKRWEIGMVKVFKWYPVIDLFDTLQVNWVMEIN